MGCETGSSRRVDRSCEPERPQKAFNSITDSKLQTSPHFRLLSFLRPAPVLSGLLPHSHRGLIVGLDFPGIRTVVPVDGVHETCHFATLLTLTMVRARIPGVW